MPTPLKGTAAPDGKGGWKARVTMPKEPGEAKPKRPWVPIPESKGHTIEWAREKAAVYTKKAAKGDRSFAPKRGPDASKPVTATIASVADAWIKLIDADPKLTPATKKQHRTSAELAIKPKLGPLAPSALAMPALRQWIRDMAADLAPSTVRNRFNSLSKMIDDAMAEGWIDLVANPTKHPKVREVLPTIEVPDDPDHLTLAQASTLIRKAPDASRRARYLVACTSGMRDGELAALTWSSIAEEKGVTCYRVTENLAQMGPEGHATRKAPKTRSGKRTLPVHSLALEALKAWRLEGWQGLIGRKPKDSDPIFPCPPRVKGGREGGAEPGDPYRPKSAELLREDLEAVGLDANYKPGVPFTMTSLRHSFATWLAASDVPETTRARLMGHARAGVTERHYTAADLDGLRRAVESIRLDVGPGGGHDSGPTGPGESNEASRDASQKGKPGRGKSNKTQTKRTVAPVAQWIEQRFPKPKVARPIRAGGAAFAADPALHWTLRSALFAREGSQVTDNELRDRFAGFAVAGLVQAGAQQLLHGGAEGSSSTKADSIAELAATAYLIAGALMLRRKEVEDAESAQRAAHRAGPPPAGSR